MVDPLRHIGHGRAGLEGNRLVLGHPVRPQSDPDQTGQPPDRRPDGIERRLVENRHGDDLEIRYGRRQALERTRGRLVRTRRRDERRLVDAGRRHLGPDDRELGGVAVSPAAVHDGVGEAQDAQERPSAATVVGRALDQARDLDELDEDAADPSEGRNRAEGRERIVAGLDLDLRQGLEQGGLAHVRRPDEGNLRCALAPDCDRVTMDCA